MNVKGEEKIINLNNSLIEKRNNKVFIYAVEKKEKSIINVKDYEISFYTLLGEKIPHYQALKRSWSNIPQFILGPFNLNKKMNKMKKVVENFFKSVQDLMKEENSENIESFEANLQQVSEAYFNGELPEETSEVLISKEWVKNFRKSDFCYGEFIEKVQEILSKV